MRTLSGAALQAKEAERKALCNKAQIFRNCFVLPIRKIAHAHAIAANTPANAGVVAGAGAAPTTAAPAATGPVPVPASAVSASTTLSTSDDEDETAATQPRFVIQTDAPSKAAPAAAAAAAAAAPSSAADSDQLPPLRSATPSPAAVAGSAAGPSASAAAATAADFLSPSASGAPLVRSCSAEQLLARDAETRVLVASAADALLKSVQSIIKRRHSMIEQGRLGLAAGAEGGASVAASRKNSRLASLRLAPLSISQPNTPQLVALRARASTLAEQLGGGSGARDPGHLQLLVLNPPSSPPRRASLSMAQAMISSGDDSAAMDELASPVLSPESRAVAEAIGRGGSGASGRSGSAAGFFHDSVVPSPASDAPPVAVADE